MYTIWLWTVVISCVVTHFLIGLFCIFTPSPMKAHRKLAKVFIRLIAKGMKMNVVVHGLENIQSDGPYIICSNHRSLIDIMVLIIAIPYHFNFVSKKELFWVPFIGLDQYFEGDFFIDRHNKKNAKKCMKRVEIAVKAGRNILIFPEGTRSKTDQLLPFKRGAFKLAADCNANVVPCYIDGSSSIVQKHSFKARPGTVSVYFLKSISPKKLSVNELQTMTFDSIQKKQKQRD
tara:strand:- start:434 stop:1129 length:696 start_codon:yes stop_codon:yes gene_type:complete